jgi:hypothetical protein
MADRKKLVADLDVGDIFQAEYPNGAKCICLVLSVDDAAIKARRVTSQENLEFDRQSGLEKADNGEPLAVINSVAPLPTEIHNVFLALDQKYRAVHGQREIFEKNPEYFKLTEAEKNAFRFIDTHYATNPVSPET